ncbi:MAG TPA: phosphopentomutase [Anaerolineales bacterium]
MTQGNRIIVIVLDGVGIGDAPDARLFNDSGSNTLMNTSIAVGGLTISNLEKLGIGKLTKIIGAESIVTPTGAYGRLTSKTAGKDSLLGHWELFGLPLEKNFPTYPNGFPKEIIEKFEKETGRNVIGNYPASGTEIIEQLGEEHLRTGSLIVYTSADSIFQIAAHKDIIPLSELYDYCQIARNLLVGEHAVARVVARPFIGRRNNFKRTEERRYFSLSPTSPTILDIVKEAGKSVIGIGKISDIFNKRGITETNLSQSTEDCMKATFSYMLKPFSGLLITNLVDFDTLYGHRNDPKGFAKELEKFDSFIPKLFSLLLPSDILVITADHGNDPTTESTDHSRERVPILVNGVNIITKFLGTRDGFADLAASIIDWLGLSWNGSGKSFASEITQGTYFDSLR